MCAFVGAEYLIANILIALKNKGVDEVSFQKLNEYGISVQRQCVENKIDVVLLLSIDKLHDAIYNFSDYFCLSKNKTTGEPIIKVNKDTNVSDLQERFIGYLPLDVIQILMQAANRIAA